MKSAENGDWMEPCLTPALLIDLAACRRNVARVTAQIGSAERWRPHVKTAKVPEVMALYLDAGIHRFKCATLKEAAVLAEVRGSGGEAPTDILLAHHLAGPGLGRLRDLQAEQPDVRFSTLVESEEQVAAAAGASLDVFIDVDLGMRRTGIDIGRADEITAIAQAAGTGFRGLHAYDGHRHELDVTERERLAHQSYDELVALSAALPACKEVITSGTPSYPVALSHAGLASLPHRVSPGTVIYHDLRTRDQLAGQPIEFAATVLTRVASLPGDDLFTVDAGSKAIEASDPARIASALALPNATALHQSEEHTVFRVDSGPRPARGQLLRLVPGHVCPTVNLAGDVILHEDGELIGRAQVAARGH